MGIPEKENLGDGDDLRMQLTNNSQTVLPSIEKDDDSHPNASAGTNSENKEDGEGMEVDTETEGAMPEDGPTQPPTQPTQGGGNTAVQGGKTLKRRFGQVRFSEADTRCYNCQGKGHFAKDCARCDAEGFIPVCVVCNSRDHYTLSKDCPVRKQKKMNPNQAFHYLFRLRQGKPPVKCDWHYWDFPLDFLRSVGGRPETPKFALERAELEKGFQDRNLRVKEPAWDAERETWTVEDYRKALAHLYPLEEDRDPTMLRDSIPPVGPRSGNGGKRKRDTENGTATGAQSTTTADPGPNRPPQPQPTFQLPSAPASILSGRGTSRRGRGGPPDLSWRTERRGGQAHGDANPPGQSNFGLTGTGPFFGQPQPVMTAPAARTAWHNADLQRPNHGYRIPPVNRAPRQSHQPSMQMYQSVMDTPAVPPALDFTVKHERQDQGYTIPQSNRAPRQPHYLDETEEFVGRAYIQMLAAREEAAALRAGGRGRGGANSGVGRTCD